MKSVLVKAVCQIGIFMICAQAIVHFRPKASYEKYLKMLLSAMIMIQILASVGGIFSEDGKDRLSERIQYFTESLNESMSQASDFTIFWEDSNLDIPEELPEKSETEGQATTELGEVTVQITPIESICVGESEHTSPEPE